MYITMECVGDEREPYVPLSWDKHNKNKDDAPIWKLCEEMKEIYKIEEDKTEGQDYNFEYPQCCYEDYSENSFEYSDEYDEEYQNENEYDEYDEMNNNIEIVSKPEFVYL